MYPFELQTSPTQAMSNQPSGYQAPQTTSQHDSEGNEIPTVGLQHIPRHRAHQHQAGAGIAQAEFTPANPPPVGDQAHAQHNDQGEPIPTVTLQHIPRHRRDQAPEELAQETITADESGTTQARTSTQHAPSSDSKVAVSAEHEPIQPSSAGQQVPSAQGTTPTNPAWTSIGSALSAFSPMMVPQFHPNQDPTRLPPKQPYGPPSNN